MRNFLFTLAAFFLCLAPGALAQQKFPAWMDEVEFKSSNSRQNQGFNGPQAPIDPATGQQSPISRPANSAFGKPNLPDFRKMREKASKAGFEKSRADSLQNIQKFRENKSSLETLLAANPGESERHELLKGIGDLDQKIALSDEFIRLLDKNTSQSGLASAVASLTDAQFDRIRELQQLLFPPGGNQPIVQTPTRQIIVNQSQQPKVVAADDEKEPTEEELRQRSIYRPGGIKSFFLESKKAQQQNEEANSE